MTEINWKKKYYWMRRRMIDLKYREARTKLFIKKELELTNLKLEIERKLRKTLQAKLKTLTENPSRRKTKWILK